MTQWTDRSVLFTPYPRTPEANWEAFFDALPDHYWSRHKAVRRFLEPCISSVGLVVSVGNLPWWMPKWWAMRTVARIAETNGVGGGAHYTVERAVLLDDDAS